MSFATVSKEAGQETLMGSQNDNDEKKENNNLGLCMSAGISTAGEDDDDQKRFQRRHFLYKTSSDIFFSDVPTEDNESSKNGVNQENLQLSPEIKTRHDDQNLSERRHFDLPSEDSIEKSGEEQLDSVGVNESATVQTAETDEVDHDETNRRHFRYKTSSDIFFCDAPSDGNGSRKNSLNRENLELSAEIETRHDDQKLSERRHFQHDSVGVNESAGVQTAETDEVYHDETNRRQFRYKTSSDIFFCDAPAEDNRSAKKNSLNQENLQFSAEIETRHDDQNQSEQHFHLPSEDSIEKSGEQHDSVGVNESPTSVQTAETDEVDHDETQRRHFHGKTSSNIFFTGLPKEDVTSRNPTNPSDFRKRKELWIE